MNDTTVNGAELLLITALNAGVEVCFANPGTTELTLVKALDRNPAMRAILCLFEGVCSGAADGYARMGGKPALTLSHLGPGFANSLANLHNAKRANTPVINIIGDHPDWHLPHDAPLTSDIEALANSVSALTTRVDTVANIPKMFLEAYHAAVKPPGQVATLIFPADLQAQEQPWVKRLPIVEPERSVVNDERIEVAGGVLKSKSDVVLLLGDQALSQRGQCAAARICAGTGARAIVETFIKRMERGGIVPDFPRLPYFPDQALNALAGANLLLVGAKNPVSFFGYPDYPSQLVSADKVLTVANANENCEAALDALADLVGAPAFSQAVVPENKITGLGPLNTTMVGEILAASLPENAGVVVEGASCGYPFYAASGSAPSHTIMTTTGGAIGQGPPCATGAAICAPDRVIVNLQSDGSALYTAQALWTQAREGLTVKTLVTSNRRYGILQEELQRSGVSEMGTSMKALTSLDNPAIDWVGLATGYGVHARRVETGEDLLAALEDSFEEPGPELIELCLP